MFNAQKSGELLLELRINTWVYIFGGFMNTLRNMLVLLAAMSLTAVMQPAFAGSNGGHGCHRHHRWHHHYHHAGMHRGGGKGGLNKQASQRPASSAPTAAPTTPAR